MTETAGRVRRELRRYLADYEWSEESRMAALKAMAVGGLGYSTTKCVIALIDYALSDLCSPSPAVMGEK